MSNKIATQAVPVGRPLFEVLDLCHAARRPVMLSGGTGVGKSTVLESFAKQGGLQFISRDLSLMEPSDLVGMPKMDGKVTRFLPPSFLPTSGEGVLVLEEINRAPAYMRAPCLQLLTARTLNDYRVPDGWWLAAAINPAGSEDNYDVADLDHALTGRFVRIDVIAEPSEWLLWAEENEIHALVRAYVRADPTVFDSAVSNPRAWRDVSELLKAREGRDLSPSLLQAVVSGCVGPEHGAAFCSLLEDGSEPLGADDVTERYDAHRETLLRWKEGGRLDLVKGTLLNVQKRLQSRGAFDEVRRDKGTWSNLALFLGDLPGDLRETAESYFGAREYPVPGARNTKKVRR